MLFFQFCFVFCKLKKDSLPSKEDRTRLSKLPCNTPAMRSAYFICFLFLPLSTWAQSFAPKTGPLAEINQDFHAAYNHWVDTYIASFGTKQRPVMVLTGDSIFFLFQHQRFSECMLPPAYHELKAVDHLALGLFSLLSSWKDGTISEDSVKKLRTYPLLIDQAFAELPKSSIRSELRSNQEKILTASQKYLAFLIQSKQNTSQDRNAFARQTAPLLLLNAEEAAKLQVELLHAEVSTWRKKMDSTDFQNLYVVVGSSHQARYRQLTLQYFDRLFHEHSGTTALNENHVVAAEGIFKEKACLSLLARHLIDQEIGLSFFGDKYRMQRDLLSDGAAKFIDPLFPEENEKKNSRKK